MVLFRHQNKQYKVQSNNIKYKVIIAYSRTIIIFWSPLWSSDCRFCLFNFCHFVSNELRNSEFQIIRKSPVGIIKNWWNTKNWYSSSYPWCISFAAQKSNELVGIPTILILTRSVILRPNTFCPISASVSKSS
jgi:hypothetical protein